VRLPVFADVDTGVDDAMALVYLLASDDAELLGVASTGGNVDVDQVCRNNLDLLQLCGASRVPVSRGAGQPLSAPLRTAEDTHGPAGLGYAELPPAADLL
jgi:purine nucleosidase